MILRASFRDVVEPACNTCKSGLGPFVDLWASIEGAARRACGHYRYNAGRKHSDRLYNIVKDQGVKLTKPRQTAIGASENVDEVREARSGGGF